jgi:hypothetical protein
MTVPADTRTLTDSEREKISDQLWTLTDKARRYRSFADQGETGSAELLNELWKDLSILAENVTYPTPERS